MKVIIELEGGLVQSVLSTDKNTEVLVVDRDLEGVDEEEIMTKNDIKKFIGKNKFFPVKRYISGVSDEDLTEIL